MLRPPADPAAFDAYYTSTHAPLVWKLPGLENFTYRHCASVDSSPPPYYLLAELSFASQEALGVAMASPEGQASGADLPNFAAGGATMFIAYD